jgi:hypothetical protein
MVQIVYSQPALSISFLKNIPNPKTLDCIHAVRDQVAINYRIQGIKKELAVASR